MLRRVEKSYLPCYYVHHACVTALLRSMTFGSKAAELRFKCTKVRSKGTMCRSMFNAAELRFKAPVGAVQMVTSLAL